MLIVLPKDIYRQHKFEFSKNANVVAINEDDPVELIAVGTVTIHARKTKNVENLLKKTKVFYGRIRVTRRTIVKFIPIRDRKVLISVEEPVFSIIKSIAEQYNLTIGEVINQGLVTFLIRIAGEEEEYLRLVKKTKSKHSKDRYIQ